MEILSASAGKNALLCLLQRETKTSFIILIKRSVLLPLNIVERRLLEILAALTSWINTSLMEVIKN